MDPASLIETALFEAITSGTRRGVRARSARSLRRIWQPRRLSAGSMMLVPQSRADAVALDGRRHRFMSTSRFAVSTRATHAA